MINRQIKLILNKKQEITLGQWLFHLRYVYNFAINKIQYNADNKIYVNKFDFLNQLAGHSSKMEIPSHVLQGTLLQAYGAWKRCFKKISKKPRFKSKRNPLNSIPFPDLIKSPQKNRITLPMIGSVKYHAQTLPEGKIKCARIIKRASGWYLCLFIDAIHTFPVKETNEAIGIDPGFSTLLTLSNGIKYENPRELRNGSERLAQSQKGKRKQLTARLHERQKNRRNNRNHKISKQLVENYHTIVYSKDSFSKLAQNKFGKSVTEASLASLIAMLNYKVAVQADRKIIAVESNYTTMTCSNCGTRSGPTGLNELAVRDWICSNCGLHHDRDVNAAVNIFNLGLGSSLKSVATREATGMCPK